LKIFFRYQKEFTRSLSQWGQRC